ncbi:hsp70 nucleotide exchange factor fes1, partial [Quaeritorhiza haematococci]
MSGKPLVASDLLHWATAITAATKKEDTTTDNSEALKNREKIDPKWLDVILGKDDAVRMRECVDVIKNSEKTEEDKVVAFDELEMLVESLDNANDLRPLNLWTPIIDVLKSDELSPRLRMHAAWVLGTAVQNNAKAQED